jgi:cytochrome c oxidase subunit 2
MRILALLFLVLFVMAACNETSPKKMDKDEILKEGPILFAKYGCTVCHSINGKIIYGPALNNIFMKEIKVTRNGQELTMIVDREYLKRAITDPRAEKVQDYQNKEMPVPAFSEEEADILVEYLILLN